MPIKIVTTISNSAHIYESDLTLVKDLLERELPEVKIIHDPRGYYGIKIIDGSISLELYSDKSKLIDIVEAKDAISLHK